MSRRLYILMLVVLAAACAVGRAAWAQNDEPAEAPQPPPVEAQPAEDGPHIEAPAEPQPEPTPQPEYTAPQPQAVPEGQPESPPPPPIMPTVRTSRPGMPATRPMPTALPPRPRPTRPGMPGMPTTPGQRPLPGALGTNANGAKNLPVDTSEKNGEKATDTVNFDYRDAPLNEVIEAIAKLTGRNFDIDPNIGATTVTVITHDKIPPEMAYQVLESILSSRGFSMVPTLDGNLIKILPTPDAANSPKNPTTVGSTHVAAKTYDQYSTHIIQVKHADPSELANALKILGSSTAKIDVYVPTNTLIITDIADGLKRMFDFLETADVPGQETSMEIFQLTYTRAEVITDQIQQVLLDTGNGAKGGQQQRNPAAPQPAPQRAPVRGRPNVPGQSQSQVIGSNEEVLRMVSDERLNSLIVVATTGMMEKVRDLVERLDTPTPYEANTLHIYELLNAEAEEVDTALQGLVGGGGGGGSRTGANSSSRRSTTGSNSNSNSRTSRFGQSSSSSRRNQQSTQGQRNGVGGAGGPSGAAADVQPFEQSVQITRYDQTNSLLIVCSPQDWKLLESVIAQLDVRQRQVHVDAVVMDVTMNDNYSVEVDSSALETGYFAQLGTQTISKLATGLATTAAAAGATATTIPTKAALDGQILGLGNNGGLSTGVFKDLEFTVSGKKVKIPFVPLFLQAIESVTDLEVLSQPSLVTVDNEEASITVGQEIPYVTSQGQTSINSTTGQPTSNGFYGGFNQVQREDVGVKLRVTPQISEGESILLEMELEISDTDANQIGDVNLLGPTLNKSLVSNKVLVKDGSTAVMAGLIRDTNTRKRAQPPVLGDVPVLGWLFRSKSNTRTKRNMVVLVTPTIIKEGQDHERVTEYKVDEFRKTNSDEEWKDKNFFRKVKQKAKDRKSFRPTIDKSDELVGERNSEKLNKGDIER